MAADQGPTAIAALVRSLLPVVAAVGIAAALQLVVRPLVGDFYAKLLLDIGTNVVLGVSLTMVNGFTGQFSMGHAAFMLVGAYVASMIVYYGSISIYGDASMRGGLLSGMPTPESGTPLFTGGDGLLVGATLTGGLFAALCGYLVGLPSLRLRGDYLAIVTLGFGEIVRVLIQALTTEVLAVGGSVAVEHKESIAAWKDVAEYDTITPELIRQVPVYLWPKYVGGSLGFTGLPFYTNLFWVFLLAGITVLVAKRIKASTYGRAFLSIREDEIASEAMGVDTTRYKVRAFVIAAFFAGCAGALFAHTSGVQLNPGELGFQKSFDIIIMVVLGGLGSISGAAVAAVILTLLPEWLREPGHVWYYGIFVMGLAMVISRHRLRAAIIIALATGGIELGRWLALRNGVDLSKFRMVIYALMLILMMILRPKGLLGVRELWDVSLWRDWLWRFGGGRSGAAPKPEARP